ncbi:hypothetical protein A8950_2457 [Dongia mobilis]|uniref:Uncharacterized protein n=1 Tax=Dongia mobilis TaxID=578943 RepID=A0A4R6WPI9_9PROT|nr:hypothetical protein [Dongia mobilis]TDQ81389.1 hypothetical protein A8950_2457 [Dongia mobilis]
MPDLLAWPGLTGICRAIGAALVLFFLLDCLLVWHFFETFKESDNLAESANGLAIGIGLLLSLMIARHHPAESLRRRFWYLAALLLLLVACNEIFDLRERANRAWADDDFLDLVVLLLTPGGLYLACRIECASGIAVTSMRVGFAFQCLSALIDLGDGPLYTWTMFGANAMNVVADISELMFIETYVFGLICLLLHAITREIPGTAGTGRGVSQ